MHENITSDSLSSACFVHGSRLRLVREMYGSAQILSAQSSQNKLTIGVCLRRRLGENSLGPKVGSEETVGAGDSRKGGLDKVAEGPGGTTRLGVAVTDTSELQKLFRDGRGDNAGTTGRGDETHDRGTALSGNLDFGN